MGLADACAPRGAIGDDAPVLARDFTVTRLQGLITISPLHTAKCTSVDENRI